MGTTMGKNGNFLDTLPSQGTLHVVMLGLDSAGKTTALYRLKFDQYLNTVPTIGFNCEKVQGTVGKAKNVQFLVWDVGGQEKLRPLWRSYTRCTDGILFVVDSVDVERMEEAKMELMRTAKCPDNQGVPVLILANKQDLPGAREPKELEKLLGLHELLSPTPMHISSTFESCSSSTGNIVACVNAVEEEVAVINSSISKASSSITSPTSQNNSSTSLLESKNYQLKLQQTSQKSLLAEEFQSALITHQSSIPCCKITNYSNHGNNSSSKLITSVTTPIPNNSSIIHASNIKTSSSAESTTMQYKGWFIQPACAITGEGLQEGLEALHDMILKRRKLKKNYKKKR